MAYIVDTGADSRNDDATEFSKFVRTNVRLLHVSGAFPQDTTENDIKGVGHGTGALAKAAGWKHGTAKRSNLVIETTGTGILNLSWGWSRDALIKADYNLDQQIYWVTEMRRYLKACVAISLLLFTYGNPTDVPDMMVVGGIGMDGVLWPRSKVDPPNQGLGTYSSGLSSISSSLQDNVPTKRVQKVKEELQTGSCIPRTDDDKICAFYNLANLRTCPPDVPPDFKDGEV
ncbi:MAG: hypothetical protein Q9217_003827 [Psora testacea]